MTTVTIKLKDGTSHELPQGSDGAFLAKKLHLTAPNEAIAVSINGTTKDLFTPLSEGDLVSFFNFEDAAGKEVFWHSSAHILAQAVLRLFPDAKPTIGPPIEQGFYYDFANLHITDEDLEKIEKEMEVIVNSNFKSQREVLSSKKEALKAFASNPYKVELIEGFEDEELTAYRQGEFYDLCRGPHIGFLGKVKAIKVLKTAGAYWRGDPLREMLTRIYAITFPDKKMLKDYLHQLEEAKKRDHKILGPKLDLFSLKEEAPGMPFIHPKGMLVWNELIRYSRECRDNANYVEIKSPLMMAKELWERSGHWANYRQNMYTSSVEEKEYAIKPMNCPGCMLYYKASHHSYRDFPLRVAEIGQVHRHEASGALSGLMRVRSFHQDDAHIFMEQEQIESEIFNLIRLIEKIYSPFGLTFEFELSTRPEKDTIGTDEDWTIATEALKSALEKSNEKFVINEGGGAFYGPKIDVHIRDALGRRWQCGTTQLDMALPERFDLLYDANDGSRKRPVMIHSAIYGSVERFFGILIEHFAGRFPLWISPRQARVVPVADRHLPFANEIYSALKQAKFHVEIDDSHESVSKKIREAQLLQVNYMLTIGDREVENKTVSLRTRDNVMVGEMKLRDFMEAIEEERKTRALHSNFQGKTNP